MTLPDKALFYVQEGGKKLQTLRKFNIEKEDSLVVMNETIRIQTRHCLQFIDITDSVHQIVADSGLRNGIANIQSRHTTAAILINENEPLLLTDLKRTLEKLASRKRRYRHDDFSIRTVNMEPGELANGHAHCKSLFLRASEIVNVCDGMLDLGRWQRVFFLELDRSRPRSVSVQLLGTV
jgi:secondary thiamine-phosphate synthase enzyme